MIEKFSNSSFEMKESAISQDKQQLIACKNESFLSKISNFIEENQITINNFWKSSRNYASAKDIIQFCKQSGLLLDIHDGINLKAELFREKQVISIYQFCSLFTYWSLEGKEVTKILKQRSDMLMNQMNKKRASSNKIYYEKITKSLKKNQLSRPNSAIKLNKNPALNVNRSGKYLRKYRQNQELQEQELAGTIEKNKNQYEYNMLLKMSQMNQKSQESKLNQTYRVFKNAEGIIRVRVFNLNTFEKEINLKQFDRLYNNFKKKINEKKEWVQSMDNKKTQQVLSYKNNQANKTQRQQQLRVFLQNTINLTNLLKEQINIFKLKGIYAYEQF